MTVTNRTWDTQAGPGFVRWDTEFPDATGQGYPGPGTFGTHTSDYCVARGVAVVEGVEALPDSTFSPVSRWLLDSTFVDEEGTDDLTLANGTEQYAAGPVSGSQAFDFDGASRVDGVTSPAPAALRIAGSVSLSLWLRTGATTGDGFGTRVFDVGLVAGGSANNFLYDLNLSTTPYKPRFLWQDSSGAFQSADSPTALTTEEWHHIVCVRDDSGGAGSTIGRIYVDGAFHLEDATLNPSFDGANVFPHVGRGDNNLAPLTGRLSGITVYNRALTQAEAMALYKKGIPPELR